MAMRVWMWAAAVGGLVGAWCVGMVWGWGSEGGGMGVVLPLSIIAGCLSAMVLGATLTIAAYIKLSTKHQVTIRVPPEISALHTLTSSICCDIESSLPARHGVVISRKIDCAINELMDTFIQNNINPWYTNIVSDPTPSIETLRNVLWYSVVSINERLGKMDQVRFLTGGVVTCLTRHLEHIRMAQAAGEARGERGVFHLVPQLSSPERERNFLRLVAELLVARCLPPEYSRCTPLRTLLKELLACKVFEPLIDRVCDPDWINQRLVAYLRQQQAAEELHRRTYMYAASYEDFITLIHDSTDVHDLKHLRRNIINEIMQATAINNLKKAKGLDVNKDSTPQGPGKGDLLQARNLKRYINQLTYAKAQCERRITVLKTGKGAEAAGSGTEKGDTDSYNSLQNLPGRKILMFQALMESAFSRRYFSMYLDEIGQGALICFWSAVQDLRHADKRLHHQLATEIYYTYLSPQTPPVKVDKPTLRGVEAFLLGNRGPEVLYEIAEEVERTLEERHYTGFLVSSTYHAMIHQAALQGVDFMTECADETGPGAGEGGPTEPVEPVQLQLSDHSTYARNKLAHLQERLTNKLLALQALRQSGKADPKVITHLEGEIAQLRADHKLLETHVERTALWSDNIGNWKVHVQSVQFVEEKEIPHLVLLVHLNSEDIKISTTSTTSTTTTTTASTTTTTSSTTSTPSTTTTTTTTTPVIQELSPCSALPPSSGTSASSTITSPTSSLSSLESSVASSAPDNGWVLVRKLPQLIDLHRKLCQISPFMKSVELPSVPSKILFSKVMDKAHVERVRTVAQNYFAAVLSDEKLCSSELIYAYLSPSPEHLKQVEIQRKKPKFSFSTFFRGGDSKSDSDEEEIGLMMEVGESPGDGGKDSVAEPLFSFLEELCELRGVSKWLRKTLISFVQITYGKTITRHVRETVSGLLSESMVLYYMHTVRDNLWPSDEGLQATQQPRTEEDKLRTRYEAREQFVNNLPVLLCTLVGQQNARRGATKLFTTLQHHALNKNLFYNALEVLLKELFPELQEHMDKKS
ncbi:sorting nexin-25-like isoform X2 [Eriocheir sinensis]|uniref:sorting nexin-25-like isoform X2 n=1 Tax=Eriocheir sinensis TaxID=95602 RepID=UPI0021C67705|nr:sorting nexin-25-like isoform X2 [Eriocheir sinensis]